LLLLFLFIFGYTNNVSLEEIHINRNGDKCKVRHVSNGGVNQGRKFAFIPGPTPDAKFKYFEWLSPLNKKYPPPDETDTGLDQRLQVLQEQARNATELIEKLQHRERTILKSVDDLGEMVKNLGNRLKVMEHVNKVEESPLVSYKRKMEPNGSKEKNKYY
jgi:hypothetical protein